MSFLILARKTFQTYNTWIFEIKKTIFFQKQTFPRIILHFHLIPLYIIINKQIFILRFQMLFPTFVLFLGTIHFSLRAFSNIIPYWNLDNFITVGNEQETSTSLVSIYPYGHIISFGVGFAYYTVTAVQSLNRIIS